MKTTVTFLGVEKVMFGRVPGRKMRVSGDRGEKIHNMLPIGDRKRAVEQLDALQPQPGDQLELEMVKNDKGYWDIVNLAKAFTAPSVPTAPNASATGPVVSVSPSYNPRSSYAALGVAVVNEMIKAGAYKKINVDLVINDVIAVSSAIDDYVTHGGPAALSSSLKATMPEVMAVEDVPSEEAVYE